MTSQPEETAPTKQPTGFFGFFAELRNQIYDDMLAPRIKKHHLGYPLICQVTEMLAPLQIITLCRQSHHDVQSRQKLGVRLALLDHRKFDPYNEVARLPDAALQAKTLDMHLVFFEPHEKCVIPILNQLQSLELVHIKVSLLVNTPTPGSLDSRWRKPQVHWTSLACLESFEVHLLDCLRTNSGFDAEQPCGRRHSVQM